MIDLECVFVDFSDKYWRRASKKKEKKQEKNINCHYLYTPKSLFHQTVLVGTSENS